MRSTTSLHPPVPGTVPPHLWHLGTSTRLSRGCNITSGHQQLKHDTMGMDDMEKKQTHLKPQDAASVDPSKLTALTPEVVSFCGFPFSRGSRSVGLTGCVFVLFYSILRFRFLVKPPSTLVQSDMWHTESLR